MTIACAIQDTIVVVDRAEMAPVFAAILIRTEVAVQFSRVSPGGNVQMTPSARLKMRGTLSLVLNGFVMATMPTVVNKFVPQELTGLITLPAVSLTRHQVVALVFGQRHSLEPASVQTTAKRTLPLP